MGQMFVVSKLEKIDLTRNQFFLQIGKMSVSQLLKSPSSGGDGKASHAGEKEIMLENVL